MPKRKRGQVIELELERAVVKKLVILTSSSSSNEGEQEGDRKCTRCKKWFWEIEYGEKEENSEFAYCEGLSGYKDDDGIETREGSCFGNSLFVFVTGMIDLNLVTITQICDECIGELLEGGFIEQKNVI